MQSNWLLDEFAHAKKMGIDVRVSGVPFEQCELERVCAMMQRGNYMLDYEGDAEGKIVALHIDYIGPFKNTTKKRCKNTKVGKNRK